jgi:hypothetical protein
MSTVTYDAMPNVRAVTTAKIPAGKRKGLFARLIEARQQQANEELRRHGLHLPRELEDAGLKIGARNEDSLPFVR